MRRPSLFPCEGSILCGTLDAAPGKSDGQTGLLIVSGGNELRSGAWGSQAQLATKIAAQGFPVFRFDRRGVGDSEGVNGGFRSSAPDIAAAVAAFRDEEPGLSRIVAFGNCDAASALMLAQGAGCDALVLSNPWTIENDGAGDSADAAPPAVLRSHYRNRLADPAALKRLLTGKVSLTGLIRSLLSAAKPAAAPNSLVQDMAAGIADFSGNIRFLVAERDRTAQAFLACWNRQDSRIHRCPGATHSFVEAAARDWLAAQVLEALRAESV